MDDFEDKLQSLRRTTPSSSLDRRMDAAFSSANERAKEKQKRPQLWWWLAAVASAGGVAAVLFVSPLRSRIEPAESSAVYRFEAQGRMREMLLNSNSRQPEPLRFDIQVHEP